MQQRQLLMLLGALGVLLLIAYISGAFSSDFAEMDVPSFDIEADQIEQLAITNDAGPAITLVKQNEQWTITSPLESPADSIALTRLTDNLSQLELESVVSSNPDRYENYGVTESAQQLSVTADGKEQTLFIGNQGPDYGSIYLRLGDDPRVFLTNGRLNAPGDLDAWRDKTILQLPVSGIEQVEVVGPTESYVVRTSPNGWEIETNAQVLPADSAGVERWLGRFAALKGMGFVDESTPADIQNEMTHSLTFTSQGGVNRSLWFTDTESQLLGTTSEQAVNVYTLSKGMLPSYVPESTTLTQSQ